jgi:acylphosphatase
MKDEQCVTIIAYGRVQGVFYRDSTRRKAMELGLVGTVRNLPDGTVQIVAQGPAPALDDLIQWAMEGPPGAAVSDLVVDYGTAVPGYADFSITF